MLSLGLFGVRNEIDVLISLGKVEQMKVALDLVGLVLLNHALQADQCDVLVGFQLPFLLLLLASLVELCCSSVMGRRLLPRHHLRPRGVRLHCPRNSPEEDRPHPH